MRTTISLDYAFNDQNDIKLIYTQQQSNCTVISCVDRLSQQCPEVVNVRLSLGIVLCRRVFSDKVEYVRMNFLLSLTIYIAWLLR
jgi:hypothetical protein